MLKKFFVGILAFSFTFFWVASSYASDLPILKRPHFLMDAQSGEILSKQVPFLRWAPASLTKMMTAYTVFRAIELQQINLLSPVPISRKAFNQRPTRIGFPVGSILTIENALKIIMVKSANDVTYALSERVGGNEKTFVALMNGHAKRLGMIDSRFKNPHGLPAEGQYTTARDMALLAYALTHEFPQYRRFFNIPAVKYKRWRMRNHNALIERFEGTNGMKTGFVCASGYNIVARTKRGNKELIAVVLGGNSSRARNVKAAKLLSEGFAGDFPKSDETIKTLKRPSDATREMYDITGEICLYQYVADAYPTSRPKDAPKPKPIKTAEATDKAADKATDEATDKAADKATDKATDKQLVIANASASVSVAALGDEDIPEDRPPTLVELFDFYLSPRKKVGEDQVIELGVPEIEVVKVKIDDTQESGSGEIPVPTKKPALD